MRNVDDGKSYTLLISWVMTAPTSFLTWQFPLIPRPDFSRSLSRTGVYLPLLRFWPDLLQGIWCVVWRWHISLKNSGVPHWRLRESYRSKEFATIMEAQNTNYVDHVRPEPSLSRCWYSYNEGNLPSWDWSYAEDSKRHNGRCHRPESPPHQ